MRHFPSSRHSYRDRHCCRHRRPSLDLRGVFGLLGLVNLLWLGLVLIVPTESEAQEPGHAAVEAAEETEEQREERDFEAMRKRLLREIKSDVRSTSDYTGIERLAPRVLRAMGDVPRHEFVGAGYEPRAYENRPLPIGSGQTISQPYIVALMTHLVDPGEDDVVLDVGTGSGYQAAVLAELSDKVYTIEIVEELGREAAARLERLGYDHVETRIGDGWAGWPEAGPFDAIVVAAAAPRIPKPLLEQLAPGGKMAIPIESGGLGEELTLVEKDEDGEIRSRSVLPVRFVPMTGEHDDTPEN